MISASERFRARAAAIPAKPPPTITMRFLGPLNAPPFGVSSPTRGKGASRVRCRASSKESLIACPRRGYQLALARARGSSRSRGCFFILPAQLEQSQQDFIALRFQLGDRARADFRVPTVNEFALDLRSQLGRPQHLPPARDGP